MNFLQLLRDVSPILVVLTFMKTAYEFIKGLKWKKSEYLSKEIKEFFSDKDVKIACLLLDYNVRKLEIGGKVFLITDDLLISSLQTHDTKQSFSLEETEIRDIFDVFFDKLSYFNIHIENDLVEKRQVITYLSYYLDILSRPGRKPEKLVNTFCNYITFYNYKNVEKLVKINNQINKNRPTLIINKLRNFIMNLYTS